jgi:ketosteroid isomerase-like protein
MPMTLEAMALRSLPRSEAGRKVRDSGDLRAKAKPRCMRTTKRMSRKALLGLLVLSAAVLAGAISSRADVAVHPHKEHKRDYKREIEAVEEQWRTAQLAGDVVTMDKLLAEDYFGISVAGQLNNKMQQLERLKSRTLVISKLEVSDMKIKLVGRVAIVTSLAEIEGMNESEPLKGKYRYTRVYKRYPDGSWKITNFEVTRVPGEN